MSWIESRDTKRGKRYYVYWYEGRVRKCAKAGPFKETAINIRNEKERQRASGEVGLQSFEKTVAEVFVEFRKESARTKKPRTLQHIDYALAKFSDYGARRIVGITAQDFKDFKNLLFDSGHSPNGVNIILSPIAAAFGYALASGYIKTNPAKSTQGRVQKVARFLDSAEIKALLDKGCAANPELRQLVLIALYSGMRQGEILKITPRMVKDGFVALEDTKTGEPRMVPIHSKIAEFVASPQWIAKWDKNRLGRAFRRAVARVKMGRVRFHDLRHTFCSGYLQSGGTLADLREISGHKTLRMLQTYAHFQKNYLKERINSLSF